jgi:hypothetical protein
MFDHHQCINSGGGSTGNLRPIMTGPSCSVNHKEIKWKGCALAQDKLVQWTLVLNSKTRNKYEIK